MASGDYGGDRDSGEKMKLVDKYVEISRVQWDKKQYNKFNLLQFFIDYTSSFW